MFGRQDDENQPVNGQPGDNNQPEPADDGTLETGKMPEEPANLPEPHSDDNQSSGSHGQPHASGSVDDDSLISIKQQVLQQLSPLVDHLDQTPEEKFKTTMMMIQASDNQSLIQRAYEAAQKIDDKKTRAQALLDIVNEINYFTHK
jgi:hypothetical protein